MYKTTIREQYFIAKILELIDRMGLFHEDRGSMEDLLCVTSSLMDEKWDVDAVMNIYAEEGYLFDVHPLAHERCDFKGRLDYGIKTNDDFITQTAPILKLLIDAQNGEPSPEVESDITPREQYCLAQWFRLFERTQALHQGFRFMDSFIDLTNELIKFDWNVNKVMELYADEPAGDLLVDIYSLDHERFNFQDVVDNIHRHSGYLDTVLPIIKIAAKAGDHIHFSKQAPDTPSWTPSV